MNTLKKTLLAGTLFVMITGTLCHFVYEWSGSHPVAGLFTPVNESTWEHMKLLFFPMLFISFFLNSRLKKEFPCITSALALGILTGTFSIPILFYSYTGILGFNLAPVDILIFFISVILGFRTVYDLALSCEKKDQGFLLVTLIFLLCICFFLFTWFPPELALFASPE